MLVLVSDDETDRASRRFAFKDSGKEFHPVVFFPGSGQKALSRSSPVQFTLDKLLVNFDASRKAVDDSADRRTVTFAETGQSENISETVTHN